MRNNKNKGITLISLCSVFVIFWGLYGFHWYDTAKDSILDSWSNVFLAVNIIICIYCIYVLYSSREIKRPPFFQHVSFFLFFFSIYGLFYIIGGDTYYVSGKPVSKVSYIIGFYRSYLPLYAFYYFTWAGKLNERSVIQYFFVLFFFYLVYDYLVSIKMLSIAGYESGFTNNLGYVFVSLFPFVYLFKKTYLQYLFTVVIIGLTVIAMKRGPILIAALLILLFLRNELSSSHGKKKAWVVILTGLIVLLGIWFVSGVLLDNSYFQVRFEQTLEGDSSGRDDLYSTILGYYLNNENIFQQLFGLGPDATLGIIGKWVHNDWLEILTCQGIVGVFVYLFFWLGFFHYWRRIPKRRIEHQVIGAFFVTQFIRSLISMSYSAVPTAAILVLGYSMATFEISKRRVKNE